MPPPPPPAGFVQLILLPSDSASLYLEIPINIINSCCLRPLRYLQYVGWCVLGVIGALEDEKENIVSLDGPVTDPRIYHYIVTDGLKHAVEPEAIEEHSSVDTTTATHENFHQKLLERDGYCVWTTLRRNEATHIIPSIRGDKWLHRIINKRPHLKEHFDPNININDIRTGVTASAGICKYLEARDVAVLKARILTPNPILQCDDIPKRLERRLNAKTSYPVNSRYTLQWLVMASPAELDFVRHNNDAVFLNHELPKPSDLLLHYNYGVCAIKHWGKNTEVLSTHDRCPL